ncbi:MAG: hypothetical protein ACFCU4_10260 [Puniceicoccaceae bacterium]
MDPNLLPTGIQSVTFSGSISHPIKLLSGFRKGIHTLPKIANSITDHFVNRTAATEIAATVEERYQEVRKAFQYKRSDLQIKLAPPPASLFCPDFTLLIDYRVHPQRPSHCLARQSFIPINLSILKHPEADGLFGSSFDTLKLTLDTPLSIENLIDQIEALPDIKGFSLNYPFDATSCEIWISGSPAQIVVEPASIALILPKPSSFLDFLSVFSALERFFQSCCFESSLPPALLPAEAES